VNGRGHRYLHPVHVGCSGWNYKEWRGTIYPTDLPASRWLAVYSQKFETVEVNATFYRLASEEAVVHWLKQTPERFVFAVKASRYLTHVRRLSGIADGIRRFYEPLQPMIQAVRLGPVLGQLPESFRRDDARLAAALDQFPAGAHALELRHASWFVPEVYALLRQHEVALVIGDHPERPFQTYEPTASWRYIRFHYGRKGRGGNYSARELQEWAERIHEWRAEGTVYAYFNNDWKAFAPRDATQLRAQIDRLG
jgi:uncharacterized protein YecE (DUF72 family)